MSPEPDLEQALRAALAEASGPGGPFETLLGFDVQTGADWATIILAEPDGARIGALYRYLHARFAEVELEVRAGNRVFRGGAGFGPGRHVVAVVGGKGGVGKSTVAVNLALTLTAMGVQTGLLDADLSGPDLPHLLGISVRERPMRAPRRVGLRTGRANRRQPVERFGVELVSVGFEVPERVAPLITTAPLVSALLREFVFDVAWKAEVLLIDAPPGTGTELQALARELPLSGALVVTTPQDLAQMDAERTVALLSDNGVPIIGMVQNMASLTCPHCAQAIDLYRLSGRLADGGVPVIGRIPFDVSLSLAADAGRPLVLGDPRGPVAYEFARIGSVVRRWLVETYPLVPS
ncbi:MAG TPA: P-loop NTPase [Dehalococcoidia bacterium]|jgi:ATP-binding protein involved in chromosome partitioning|nr:P-loop NTPase [Dehalococcoidia bacterium]